MLGVGANTCVYPDVICLQNVCIGRQAQTHIGQSVLCKHKQKKGRTTQGSPLNFYIITFIHLPFYHFRYHTVGSDGVDACGQVGDVDTVGIGGVGYFDAVNIIYPYGASGSREV